MSLTWAKPLLTWLKVKEHITKMGLKLKMKHQHACAQIRQLQIFGLVGRHLGAKLKSKLKMNPNMGPQANHQLKLNLQPIMHLQVKLNTGTNNMQTNTTHAKTTPDMRKVKEHQPNMHMQVNHQQQLKLGPDMGKVNISTHISTQVKQQLNNDQQENLQPNMHQQVKQQLNNDQQVNQLKMQPKVKQQLNMHQQVNQQLNMQQTNNMLNNLMQKKPKMLNNLKPMHISTGLTSDQLSAHTLLTPNSAQNDLAPI